MLTHSLGHWKSVDQLKTVTVVLNIIHFVPLTQIVQQTERRLLVADVMLMNGNKNSYTME